MGLAVTCHLYLGQNDQDLCATVVTDAIIIAQKVDPGKNIFLQLLPELELVPGSLPLSYPH